MRRLLTVVLIAALCLPVIALVGWRLLGGTVLTVQTNSMQPTFSAGDALLVRPLKHLPQPGEVVSYHSNQQTSVVVSHRVQQVLKPGPKYITQGDALTDADLPIRDYQLLGRPVAVLPSFGRVVQWLRSPVGLGLGVYLPAALIIGFEVTRSQR